MFDDFLNNCRPEDEINPSEERVEKNIASVKSLIEKEEKVVTKRRFGIKPLIIAAAIAILSGVSLLSVSAAIQGTTINFIMGGKEIEGEYYDYVDSEGYRQISFEAVLPLYEENFAIIYDVDAPQGENVRVITKETDPGFMENLRLYIAARHNYLDQFDGVYYIDPNDPIDPQPEDFGLVFKDSELCRYSWSDGYVFGSGTIGEKFMHTGVADGKPSGLSESSAYDPENNTKIHKCKFYYYVGKE